MKSISDPHAHHTSGVLSITESTDDGGQIHQSWDMCGCLLQKIRETLGEPLHELIATAGQAESVGDAVNAVPGIAHLPRH